MAWCHGVRKFKRDARRAGPAEGRHEDAAARYEREQGDEEPAMHFCGFELHVAWRAERVHSSVSSTRRYRETTVNTTDGVYAQETRVAAPVKNWSKIKSGFSGTSCIVSYGRNRLKE